MITKEEYVEYLGVTTAPNNFERLENLSINALKTIMVERIPDKGSPLYSEFKKAIIEQMNYFVQNPELIDENSLSEGFTLGAFSMSGSNNENSKSINKISPGSYDILLNIGMLYMGIERC